MTIRIITLDREYGSGGGVIAERLASRLGWKLWDQLLTDEIARRMDCDCRDVEKHERKETRRIIGSSSRSCGAVSRGA